MDVIKVGDVALRLWELPTIADAELADGHRLLVDGPALTAGQVAPSTIVLGALARLPLDNNPVGQAVEVLVRDNGQIRLVPRGVVAADYYLGPFAEAPTSGPTGQPLLTGMTYFNTGFNEMQVWTGTAWLPFGTPYPAQVGAYVYRITGSTTVIGGADAYGDVLAFYVDEPDSIQVFKNGLLLDPADYTLNADQTITLDTAVTSGTVEILTWLHALTATPLDPAGLATGGWVADGIQQTFPLKDFQGQTLNAATPYQLNINVNGRQLNPATEYTTGPGTVTFVVPLPPGAAVWGSYGQLQETALPEAALAVATETGLEVGPGVLLTADGAALAIYESALISVAPVLPPASAEYVGRFLLVGMSAGVTQSLKVCRLVAGVPAWSTVTLT